ncbi:MAG: glutamine synthetase family protein [Lachnospiraceae bacterium]
MKESMELPGSQVKVVSKMKYTREDIIHMIEEEDVEFIRLQFRDMFGMIKNLAVTASQVERALDNGMVFDGSLIDGFSDVEDCDMVLVPDLDTFVIYPWRPQNGKVARLICDVHRKDGGEFEGDSRLILKHVLSDLKDQGMECQIGTACEFFLLPTDEHLNVDIHAQELGGMFDVAPLDQGENVRRDIVLNLEEIGMEVSSSFHALAPHQHEVMLGEVEGLTAADNIANFRMAVQTIARRHGFHATFMPKPRNDVAGSAMQMVISMNDKDGHNLFDDKEDENGLSEMAYYFMGGILSHIKGASLITNPLVNSYKRLCKGYSAPVFIAWSTSNNCPVIRTRRRMDGTMALELRWPDVTANPYLSIAVCMAAGMEGIKNKIRPTKEVNCNLFEMSEQEREKMGIHRLPRSLGAAIEEFEKDELMQKVVGKHITSCFVNAKKKEWERYRSYVTDWELEEYLHKF